MSENKTTVSLVCMAITAKGKECGKPAKGRLLGNMPVCGLHLRSAEQRGEETREI